MNGQTMSPRTRMHFMLKVLVLVLVLVFNVIFGIAVQVFCMREPGQSVWDAFHVVITGHQWLAFMLTMLASLSVMYLLYQWLVARIPVDTEDYRRSGLARWRHTSDISVKFVKFFTHSAGEERFRGNNIEDAHYANVCEEGRAELLHPRNGVKGITSKPVWPIIQESGR